MRVKRLLTACYPEAGLGTRQLYAAAAPRRTRCELMDSTAVLNQHL